MTTELVERAQAGDRDAFDLLASKAVDRLYAVARLILRDTDRAEDAVQETLVRCWRDLPSLRDPARFDAWLHRLLVRAITDQFRSSRRESSIRMLNPDRSIPDASERIAVREEIERGFARLSVEHRTVIVLRLYLGLSIEEAAAALSVPTGTVKSRLHYAIDAMRAALEAESPPALSEASR